MMTCPSTSPHGKIPGMVVLSCVVRAAVLNILLCNGVHPDSEDLSLLLYQFVTLQYTMYALYGWTGWHTLLYLLLC